MADTGKHPSGEESKKPQNQTDESFGSVKGEQLNDRNSPEIDNPRGAETGGGVGGGGPHRPGRHR